MNATVYCNKCGVASTSDSQFCRNCGATLGTAPAVPAPAQPVATYSSAAVAGPYGGFWIRFVAFIIDAIIVRAAITPFAMIFGGLTWLAGSGNWDESVPHIAVMVLGGGVTLMLVVVAGWLYEALMLSSKYQATLGKMIFGMRVTDLYGNRISFARATGRHFGKWLSSFILFIGYIMVGFTERKQGLHDMLAGTLVRRS